jgi:hypothetical protein
MNVRPLWPLVLLGAWLVPAARASAQAERLDPLLRIDWRKGPEYPMGIQDSVLGVVHGQLVSAGGFTRHPKEVVRTFPDAFGGEKSGFTRLAFRLDPAREEASWTRTADVPGAARQGAAMVVVDDALYAIGGFNYTAPWTYRDVCRLRKRDGKWAWEKLPCDLPWPVCEASATAVGRKIYLVGGADYFKAPGAGNEDFHSERGRGGQPVGRALLELDTTDVRAGWKRLPDRPGTGQFDCAAAAVGDKVYVLGGIFAPAKAMSPPYFNAVDSWVYSVPEGKWSPLRDMPHGSNRRAVSYKDRYILLISGYKYAQTWRPDGKKVDAYSPREKAQDWKQFFEKAVLVYDTRTGRLGRADPLREQTSWPMVALSGDRIYCLGGEGGSRLWHPATLQVGRVREE